MISYSSLALSQENNTSIKNKQQKIRILVLDFTDVSVRADKYLYYKKKNVPVEDDEIVKPKDLANLNQYDVERYSRREIDDRFSQRDKARKEVDNENKRMEAKREVQRKQLLGNQTGRNILLGADTLASKLSQYSDFIDIIDRKEQDVLFQEQGEGMVGLIQNDQIVKLGKQLGITHLVRGIVSDFTPRQITTETYGGKVASVQYKVGLNISVIDIEKMSQVYSKVITEEDKQIYTQYASVKGGNIQGELLDKAISNAAEDILNYFTVNLTINVKQPLDEEIQIENANILIDDAQYNNGEKVRLLKGDHDISVELDDCEPYKSQIHLTKDMVKPVALKSKYTYVDFKFNSTKDFDILSAKIELLDQDNNTQLLTGPGPHRILKGSYNAKVYTNDHNEFSFKLNALNGTNKKPAIFTVDLKK